jgi:hypothetical protein
MKHNKENEKGKCKKRWYYILPSRVFVYCDERDIINILQNSNVQCLDYGIGI